MGYREISIGQFFKTVRNEEQAREIAWRMKTRLYKCARCESGKFWTLKSRPEVRHCQRCGFHNRLRVGTIFENSKLPLLTWMRAIFLMMQDKRGISSLAAQRLLGMSSYGTTWAMLLKIRRALRERDSIYKIKDVIEIDGAYFGKRATQNQESVFVAVERKEWIDARGKRKLKTGFAKIMHDDDLMESRKGADKFVKENIKENSTLLSDSRPVYQGHASVKSIQVESSVETLPLVHRFISNAKRWLLGTHHGVKKNYKYLNYYLSEYTYRFNRRHDPNSLFSRTLYACLHTTPATIHALSG